MDRLDAVSRFPNDGQCPGSTCAGVGVDDDIIVDTPVAELPFFPIN